LTATSSAADTTVCSASRSTPRCGTGSWPRCRPANRALAEAAKQHGLTELVLSGGGSANQTTLRWLREAVPGVRVLTTAELGVPAQAKEAAAFAGSAS
jgi:hypothetical protein